MKKIFFLLIMVFCFVSGVKAEVVFDDNFKISFNPLYNKVQNLIDDKYISVNIKSNNEEFDGMTNVGFSVLGKYYYKVNGGEEKELIIYDDSFVKYIEVQQALQTTNELKIQVIFKTNDGKEYKTDILEILVLEDDDELLEVEKFHDKDTGVKVLATDLPYNTKITTERITDETLLKKVGYTEPSMFKVNISSFGKDLKYYSDKYNYELFNVKLMLPVDKRYNYDATSYETQLLGQILGDDFKTLDTILDMDDVDSTYFYTSIIKEEYLDDYFVLSTDIKIIFDEEKDEKDDLWENFVDKYKKSDALKSFKDLTVSHTDDSMKVIFKNNNVTYETNFEYKNGIVSYVPTDNKEQSIIDALFVVNCLYAISELKDYDVDSVIEWFKDNPLLTLEKDGIEYKSSKSTLESENGSFSSNAFESFKLDIKNGLKTYNAKEEPKKEPVEEEKIPENPHTGITRGIITLAELLILGVLFFVIKNKKVSFSKIKK